LWGGEIEGAITVEEQMSIASGKARAEARSQATQLRRTLKEGDVTAFWNKQLEITRRNSADIVELASACAAAGRLEESLDLLDRAYFEHYKVGYCMLLASPEWDNLRGQRAVP
jgi:hypothetical protein